MSELEFKFPEELESMEEITELELTNGVSVPINTNLSLGQMKRYKSQGLLDDKTLNNMLQGKMDNIGNDKSIQNAPFIAYVSAGGQMTQDEFEDLLPYEVDTSMMIYTQLIMSKRAQNKNHFRQKLQQATKK